MSWSWLDTRLVESLGTCKTLLRLKEGFTLTTPWPTIVTKDPSAIVIFLLLGHGIYVLNFFNECVIWSITLESMIQELARDIPNALKAWEKGNLLEFVREQTPISFSNEPNFFSTF